MSDISLDTISTLDRLSAINDNFSVIEGAVNDEVLHRSGGNNTMSQSLDMNSHRILNIPAPVGPTDVVRLQDLDSIVADGYTDASLLTYTPAGTGAEARTVQSVLRETVLVTDFGTPQEAIDYAATLDSSEVVFPAGTYDVEMLFIDGDNIKLTGHNAIIVQNHDSTNSTEVGGTGQYKVSSAFFIKRGSSNIEITGFTFETDDASFPAYATGYGSYFPSIAGQAFDGLKIHNCRFLGGQRRALFTQGGKHLHFYDNYIENCGITIHVGYSANQLFYDTTTDIAGKYSPYAPYIVNNIFNGYSSTAVTTCLFLTGAIKFTVRDNKIINMNEATALRPLMIYSNDYGPYDEDGTARAYIEGDVVNNVIQGTYKDALEVRGLSPNGVSTWTSNYEMRVNVQGNKIVGTGNGIKLQEVYNTKVRGNYVYVSASPLYCDQRIVHVDIRENLLQSVTNGYDDTTIYLGWGAGSGGFTFEQNRVITPTGSVYAMRSVTIATNVDVNRNYFFFDADGSSCRPIVLTIANRGRFNGNTFNIETNTANITCLVLTGSGTRAQLEVIGNDAFAINGTGASSFRFCSFSSFYDVYLERNTTGGGCIIESSYRVRASRNTVVVPSSGSIRGIFIDNSALNAKSYAWVDSNHIVMPTGLNNPGIGIASYNNSTNNTLSKVTMNYVEGDSAGALITQTTHGTVEHLGNTVVNTGGGGTSIAVTGSATATAL